MQEGTPDQNTNPNANQQWAGAGNGMPATAGKGLQNQMEPINSPVATAMEQDSPGNSTMDLTGGQSGKFDSATATPACTLTGGHSAVQLPESVSTVLDPALQYHSLMSSPAIKFVFLASQGTSQGIWWSWRGLVLMTPQATAWGATRMCWRLASTLPGGQW